MMIQKTKYDTYMAQEYVPIKSENIRYFVDYRGLRSYAESRGLKISELTEDEKREFVYPRVAHNDFEHNHAWVTQNSPSKR